MCFRGREGCCQIGIRRLIAHHVKQRDHRVDFSSEANRARVALRESHACADLRLDGIELCLRRFEHSRASIDAMYDKSKRSELTSVTARATSNLERPGCTCGVPFNQRRDITRFPCVILVAIEKIVVARVCCEYAQARIRFTA